ncbi:ABC-three component system middle component 8 [Psychrobacter urativorans]|uniref:ABC-three component system middle component 8 n=1 Tax=Psychrobacter urativorans TaxID=45610 RepID=UPI0019193BBB|nr:ABC-three component system middle component 8 [Psychrobacter urativorans]
MIKPTKHSHPDKTVIYVSFIMLKELRKKRVIGYSDLFQLIKDKVTSGEFLFMPTLNLLFLLGLIEYKAKTDSIEYIEKK